MNAISRRTLLVVPVGVHTEATSGWNRYDTDDEHVLHLWANDESWDFRMPRTHEPPEGERVCARSGCWHGERFHTPSCKCGCEAFVGEPLRCLTCGALTTTPSSDCPDPCHGAAPGKPREVPK
jgi:hypothetical protein